MGPLLECCVSLQGVLPLPLQRSAGPLGPQAYMDRAGKRAAPDPGGVPASGYRVPYPSILHASRRTAAETLPLVAPPLAPARRSFSPPATPLCSLRPEPLPNALWLPLPRGSRAVASCRTPVPCDQTVALPATNLLPARKSRP